MIPPQAGKRVFYLSSKRFKIAMRPSVVTILGSVLMAIVIKKNLMLDAT